MNQTIRSGLLVVGLLLPGVGLVSHVASATGCSPAAQQEVKTVVDDVLTASQIACILATALTDANEVAVACKIDSKLVPLITPLLEQKAAAKRAAACAPDKKK
jgi:hypothetical protein